MSLCLPRLAALLLLGAAILPAAEPEVARVALLRAVTEAPALSAAARRAEAARARVEAAGRLPDPEVEGMISRMDGPMGDRSTMYEVTLRQPLPRRGERAADRERARAGVSMAEADHAALAGGMAAEVAMALAEAEAATRRAALLGTQRTRLEAVLRSIQTRLAAGSEARLADRLSVETRLAAMSLAIDDERRLAADAEAEARSRLGLPADAPLPAFSAPSPDEIAPDAAAVVKLAQARSGEAAAMGRMAQASARPMTAVGLRLERERMRRGDEDTVGLAFMSEIPWRSRTYARAEVRAAGAERAAAEADAESARFRIAALLSRVGRAERLAASARRLAEDTLARLDAEYDALLRASGVAGPAEAAVFQTVELLEKATEAELQVVQADLAARLARAELWRYLPADSLSSLSNASSTSP